MARVIRRRWQGDIASGLSRRDRRSCEYDAYVPDPLVGQSIMLDGDVAAEVADAERAITQLNAEAVVLVDTEALARLLLRAESVASSKIEGLEVGGRRLLRAETARDLGENLSDVTAIEVLGNIHAMVWAIQTAAEGGAISVDDIFEVHRRLLAGTRLGTHGGHIRTEQNWIGGSSYNPCSAAFVPPPAEMVPKLLEDLCLFCNGDSLPAVVQAAIAHAQFETIHPFVDGNGRTGRALIHLVFRRRGLAPRIIVPVSLLLATWVNDYVDGLTVTRYRGPATSHQAHEGWNQWIALFAAASRRATEDATTFEQQFLQLQNRWRARLGRVRANSSVDLLLQALPGAPIITVTSAQDIIGRSYEQTNQGIDRLVQTDILRQVTVGRRNRAFEAPDVIQAFTDLERRLASPVGDTQISAPARAVPRRDNRKPPRR